MVFDDLRAFNARLVVLGGQLVAQARRIMTSDPPKAVERDFLRSRVDFPRPFEASDFRIRANGTTAQVRVIRVHDGTLVSDAVERTLAVENGEVLPDLQADILKVAVIDRH